MTVDSPQPEGLVSYLKRISDDDLEELCEAQERAAAHLLGGFVRREQSLLEERPEELTALMQLEAGIADEQYRRADLLRHAEAELNDGQETS